MLNFKPASSFTEDELTKLYSVKNNRAKLAVANTYISDLHRANFGFDGEELVVIDLDMRLDSHNENATPTDKVLSCLQIGAAHLVIDYTNVPALTKDDIETMRKLYLRMQKDPLPPTEYMFGMTGEMYNILTGEYINVCGSVLKVLNDPALTERFKAEVKSPKYINDLFYRFTKNIVDTTRAQLTQNSQSKPEL